MMGPLFEDNSAHAINEMTHLENTIHLKSPGIITEIFNSFGDLLHRLIIYFDGMNTDDGKQIMQLINKKCSNSLTFIKIVDCTQDVLEQLNTTFKNVHTLVFQRSTKLKIEITSGKMNKTFPNVKNLSVQFRFPHWSFIDGTFSKLEMLSVHVPTYKSKIVDYNTHIVDFLKNNVQIVGLMLICGDLNLLKGISETLPNLKTLQVSRFSKDYLNYEGEPIEFRSVRDLRIFLEDEKEFPAMIKFPRLNTLVLDVIFNGRWLKFLTEQVNAKLKILSVHAQNPVQNSHTSNEFFANESLFIEHFIDMSKYAPNLRVVHFKTHRKLFAKDIVSFVEMCKQCTNLCFETRMDPSDRDEMEAILSKKWHIDVLKLNPDADISTNSIKLNR